MARLAIPDFGVEYPPYVNQPFPRYVGLDAEGNALIAQNEKEVDELKPLAVFPKNMGKDKDGKDVIAQNDRDLTFFKSRVVTPPEDPEVVAKREADRIAAEEETKRKAAEYDKMMAEKGEKKDAPNAEPEAPAEDPPAPTGLKKSKAA